MTTRLSERVTERAVLDCLSRRYASRVRTPRGTTPRYSRAEHVPVGLQGRRYSIADFIAVDMQAASSGYDVPQDARWWVNPPVFHGHEVKVSRSDWLHELKQPGKSEAWRSVCHFWWLVVSDAAIVRDDLPEGWGLMVRHGQTTRVVVPAPANLAPEPMGLAMQGALLRATAKTEQNLTAKEPR